jgi:hypothetical protein
MLKFAKKTSVFAEPKEHKSTRTYLVTHILEK